MRAKIVAILSGVAAFFAAAFAFCFKVLVKSKAAERKAVADRKGIVEGVKKYEAMKSEVENADKKNDDVVAGGNVDWNATFAKLRDNKPKRDHKN